MPPLIAPLVVLETMPGLVQSSETVRAPLLADKRPELTRRAEIVPKPDSEPALVTVEPARNAFDKTAAPRNVAPATELVSTPLPVTMSKPFVDVPPLRSNSPPETVPVPVMVAAPLTERLPAVC